MIAALLILTAAVILFGVLFLLRLDRLERRIEELSRKEHFTEHPSASISARQQPPAPRPAAPGHPVPPIPPPYKAAAPQPPAYRKKDPPRKADFEKYIGENLFGKIGIFVLIVGVGFFVKYAIDNRWLSETVRTTLGFVTGGILLGVAGLLRDRYRSFSSLLAGGAFAVVYITTTIAYHYYDLFSQGGCFAVLAGVTLLASGIALRCSRRELAVVALAGGLLAPFLASDGKVDYVFLFFYLSILHTGMFALSLHKRWWELPVVSFSATWLIMALFLAARYPFEGYSGLLATRDMLGFSTFFFLLFASSVIAVFRAENRKAHTWLTAIVTLNNFIYLGYGLFFLSRIDTLHRIEGLLPLLIAAVNGFLLAGVRGRRERDTQLDTLLLGMVLLFVTLAAPIQLRANTLLICWAAETVVLLALYVRTRNRVYDYSAAALCTLTFFTGLLLLGGTADSTLSRGREFLSVLFAAAALGAAAWLTHRKRDTFRQARAMRYTPVNAALIIGSVTLFYLSFLREFAARLSGDPRALAILIFSELTLYGTGLLLRSRFPLRNFPMLYFAEAGLAVLLYLSLSRTDGATAFTAWGSWLTAAVAILILTQVAIRYYTCPERPVSRQKFDLFLNSLATILWITMVCRALGQAGIENQFSTEFSVAMISAGIVQMTLGMRRNRKSLRLFSLGVLALVLLKLLFHDLWEFPTLGRIVVFILLGTTLLTLSFLYQRLKTVLFKKD